MENLDFYLSTPDEHFNHNAQNWYFQFKGTNKPNSEKPFEIFIHALHESYFFITSNIEQPFACIEQIKKVSMANNLSQNETLILIDKILGILSHADADIFGKVFIQIVDYRDDLSPYENDPEIKNHKFEFDFDLLKEETTTIENPIDKIKFINNTMHDFIEKSYGMENLDLEYYQSIGFIELCQNEIARISNEISPAQSLLNEQVLLKFRQHYHERAVEICNLLIEKYNKDESKFPSLIETQMIESKLESIRPEIERLRTKFNQIDISSVKSFDDDTIFLFGYLMFQDKLVARLKELRDDVGKHPNGNYTHREYVLESRYLAEAGLKKEATAKEMKKISSKRYEAFLSLTPGSKTATFREPTKKEMLRVIELLRDSPDAQDLAKKALQSLK